MTATSASTGRIKAIGEPGQQIWLDNLSRELISSGSLASWIAEDGVQGLPSNPSIFFNAIRSDVAYQAALPALRKALGDPDARFEALVLPDVQRACDLFYRHHRGRHRRARPSWPGKVSNSIQLITTC